MTADNLNIVLTNSLCCISAQAVKVSKLYSIGDKCADSELQKLKLMNDWFEALRCYNANESINSKFTLKLEYDPYNNALNAISTSAKLYVIVINNIEYSVVGDNVSTVIALITTLIGTITEIVSFTVIISPDGYTGRFVYLNIEADCDITEFSLKTIRISDNVELSNISFILYQLGQCTVLNCLTEADFNIIVAKLMKECDICECQLNQ